MQSSSRDGDGTSHVQAIQPNLHQAMESDITDQEGQQPATKNPDDDFIEVVSRSQRRRQRGIITPSAPTVGLPPAQAQAASLMQTRKPTFRPQPLPRDDYKLVLRPQGGLRLRDVEYAEIALALLNAINATWRKANLRLRIDSIQNTATISTPSAEAARALVQVKQITLGTAVHPVSLYGLAPDDARKGVIHGVPLRFTNNDILSNLDQTEHEIYAVRRLGQTTTVILTFAGPKVPYFVRLYGAEYPCSLHKKTVPVCATCHDVGHRSTACPQPSIQVCHNCGLRDPAPDHPCFPTCGLCGGPHLSGSPGCTKRYAEPYILRQRRLRQVDAASRDRARDPTPPLRGRRKERSVTPSSRRRSRSKSKGPGGAAAGPAAHKEDSKQVSWAQHVSRTALHQTLSHTQSPQDNTQCHECSQLLQILEQQKIMIASLQSRLEALECAPPSTNPEKRKKPNPDFEPIAHSSTPAADQNHTLQTGNQLSSSQDVFAQLVNQLGNLNEEIKNLRSDNVILRQEFQSLKEDLATLRQETQAFVVVNSGGLETRTDAGPIRQDRIDGCGSRSHRRAVPYARTVDGMTCHPPSDGHDTL